MSRNVLASYFGLTYLVTWSFTIPMVYTWRVILEGSFSPWLLVFLPAPFGPTIAALIMTHRLEGKEGVKALLSKVLVWRVHIIWYACIFLLPTAWVLCSVALSSFREEAFAGIAPVTLLTVAPLYWLVALPFGPLAEELGWRGFALPRLQDRFSPLVASLILGTVWTFWHTPMFWFAGAAIPSFLALSWFSVGLYLMQTLALAILFTSLFNRTRASVLLAIIFHTTYNAAENIVFESLPEPTAAQQLEVYLWTIALMWALALLSLFLNTKKARQPVAIVPLK